jgi:general stress protein CsbA
VKSPESRRISSLLAERRVSGVAMVAVLSVALLFGLVGFAFHTLWVVTIVVLALGLGYVVANVRQDRRDRLQTGPALNGSVDIGDRTIGTSTLPQGS